MRTPHLNAKLQGFGTTIFAEMSALATATGAINLGQGFPDVDGPSEVLEAAVDAIRSGRGNQYPPGTGIPELRHAIATHQHRFYGITLDPDCQVLVTTGATEAIAAAMLALLETGDECILLEPFYDSYPAGIAMAGAICVPVTLHPPVTLQPPVAHADGSFQLDLDQLRGAITARTKLLVVNTPHNPSGTVFERATLEGIAALAIEHDLLVLSDEAYEHLTYDGATHIPISTLPGMADRTITVGSAGKTFSLTGWKVGWVTGTPELVTAVRTAKQFLTYVSAGPFQYAIAVGLGLPDTFYREFADALAAKRDRLATGLRNAEFTVYQPRGTYFITTDIRPLGESDGMAFCRSLPERCGLVAVPNVVFYINKPAGRSLVRFAFCKRNDVIDDAVRRLTSRADGRAT